MRLERDSEFLHALGQVVGNAERPLDLYLLLDGKTVAYTTITATPEGQAFHLISDKLDTANGPFQAQVDLVNGAVVWYRHEG